MNTIDSRSTMSTNGAVRSLIELKNDINTEIFLNLYFLSKNINFDLMTTKLETNQ